MSKDPTTSQARWYTKGADNVGFFERGQDLVGRGEVKGSGAKSPQWQAF